MKKFYQEPARLAMRAAMTLLLAVMTTATAWADDIIVTDQTTWKGGNTYHVESDMTIDSRISVTGDVTLFIADGVTLTANQGITISSGTLTIEGPGTLIATGQNGNPGENYRIGKPGGNGTDGISGSVIVKGATVNATGGNGGDGGNATLDISRGGDGGAGGAGISGNVTFNSGTVMATGGAGGAGGTGNSGNGSAGATGKGIGGTVSCANGAKAQDRDNSTWNVLTGNSSSKRYVWLSTDPNSSVAYDIDVTSSTTEWADGIKYHVTSSMTIDSRISVTGNATLIIADGVTLTASQGITVADGYTLAIEGPGTLIATGQNGQNGGQNQNGFDGTAGISGNVIINGATVNATGGNGGVGGSFGTKMGGWGKSGGAGAAGISGNVTITDGIVNAMGGNGGNGSNAIKVGKSGGVGGAGGAGGTGINGNVIFNGGAVNATGGNGGNGGNGNDYGVMDGYGGAGGAGAAGISGGFTITSGIANATGGSGGDGGDGGDINLSELSGYFPTVKGNMGGNGGDGAVGIMGNVTLNGGTVIATGGAGSIGGAGGMVVNDNYVLGYPGDNGSNGAVGKGIGGTVSCANGAKAQDRDDNSTWNVLTGNSSSKRYVWLSTDPNSSVAYDIDVTSSTTEWVDGFKYHVTSSMTIGSRISVTGNVTLIIADGVTLTACQGITITNGTLAIEGLGTLNATGKNGEKGLNGNGGVVSPGIETASGSDGENGQAGAPGISGNIIVNGVIVNATGGNGGNGGSGGINISGQMCGNGGAGGAGGAGISGNVTFYGGAVNAMGGVGGNGDYGENGNAANGATGKGIGGTVTCNNGATALESDDNSTWYDLTTGSSQKRYVKVTPLSVLSLANDDDNTTAIADAAVSGKAYNVILSGRTLYKDGYWNTLCLPFAVGDATAAAGHHFDGTPLVDATVMELVGTTSNLNGNTLTLNFSEATSIEAGKPYIVKWDNSSTLFINSAADWTAFAQRVEAGETFAGKKVLLNADINVSTMVGSSTNPFCGTFDGNGHTLNLSISQPDIPCVAPFSYISNATIRNLKTTGSVYGGLHSAGLVGAATGNTNSISNCWMDAEVTTSVTGTSFIGGILGHGTTSATTISNCYLTGSLTATNVGIFYGWGDNGTHAIENCWAMGTYSASGSLNLVLSNGGTVSANNCRRNNNDDRITQGEYYVPSFTIQISTFLGSQWTTENAELILKSDPYAPGSDIVSPVFAGVTISGSASMEVSFTGGKFIGTYSPVPFTANDKSVLFLGAENKLYWPSADMNLGSNRAYFKLNGGSAVKEFKLNFGDSEENTTGVIEVSEVNASLEVNDNSWYDMQGRRLGGKPAQSGLYIYNGKKVLLK